MGSGRPCGGEIKAKSTNVLLAAKAVRSHQPIGCEDFNKIEKADDTHVSSAARDCAMEVYNNRVKKNIKKIDITM